MVISGIKDNKCFQPIVKCTGTVTISIPANTSTPRFQIITNDAISSGDVVCATPVYADSAIQEGGVSYWTSVVGHNASVYIKATDDAAHEITFNVVVLAGASSE